MLSSWVVMVVGGRHDFAHNHQRTPRGMARADFSSFYSRSCGHIGARGPRRQRRRQRGRCRVDDRPRHLHHCCNAGRLHQWKRSICSRGGLTPTPISPAGPHFQRRARAAGRDARCAPFALEVDTGVLPRKHAGAQSGPCSRCCQVGVCGRRRSRPGATHPQCWLRRLISPPASAKSRAVYDAGTA